MHLTPEQRFEIERLSRAIDAETDPQVLRNLCRQLLLSWQVQRSCTTWAMRQSLSCPPSCGQHDPQWLH